MTTEAMLVTQEDANLLYKQLAVAHKLAGALSHGDPEKYVGMFTLGIIKCVGMLGNSKTDSPLFESELFKEEMRQGLNNCLLDEQLIEDFGELWIAKDNSINEVLEAIAMSMHSEVMESMQAQYN